jgi:hypothetical protein
MEKSGEQFLHQRDQRLHTSTPVEHEQERRQRAEEEVSQKPADKLAAWMQVLERTHMGHMDDPRVLERIKDYYHHNPPWVPGFLRYNEILIEIKSSDWT